MVTKFLNNNNISFLDSLTMLYGLFLHILLMYSCAAVCTSSKAACSKMFLDKVGLLPVGCSQASSTATGSSKLSCAMTCKPNENCAAFEYNTKTKLCLLCQRDRIQNLTFNTIHSYTWPYQYIETNVPVVNLFSSLSKPVPALAIGSLVCTSSKTLFCFTRFIIG